MVFQDLQSSVKAYMTQSMNIERED